MKNELGFIPDTISAISGASMHIQPNLNFQPGQQHHDSTDMFIDEILRQRAERLQKEQEKMESAFLSNLNSRPLFETRDLGENMTSSENKLKQSLRNSRHKLNKLEMLMRQNESIAQKSQVSEANDSASESKIEPVKNHSGDFSKKQPLMIEDRIETLQNQTNQQITMEKQLNQSLQFSEEKIEEMQKISDHFELPKIDKIVNFQLNNASKKSSQLADKQKEELSKKSIIVSEKYNSEIRKSGKVANNQHKKSSDNHSSSKKSQNDGQINEKQVNQKSNSSKKSSTNKKLSNVEAKIQNANSMIEDKGIMMETPVKMFNQPVGFYQFVENNHNSLNQQTPYRQIAMAIADQLNKIQRVQPTKKQNDNEFSLVAQNKSKSNNSYKNISVKEQASSEKKDSLKLDIQQDDLQTQYSEFSRDIKILQHRYQSNLSYLQAQAKELLGYYNFMIMQEQKKELRKEIMKLEITNNHLKIQHRTASYTKRFNFISPMAKTKNKPIQFTTKKQVSQQLLMYCNELKIKMEEEKKLHVYHEEKLQLLTKYYQLIKSRTISDNLEFPTQYKFDSVLGMFSPIKGRENLNDSECSIGYGFQRTSKTNLSKSKSKTTMMKGMSTSAFKKKNTQQKIKLTPQAAYNLNKYKAQIAKEMVVQFQVYNLGRMKRIKDQTKLLKKELQFVDSQISHFQKSFAEELKAYEQLAKPKINYDTFKVQQKQNLYTVSPFSRDYFGNNKGMNNINIYRPDTSPHSPQKRKMDKSLSQSKYTIRRSNKFQNGSIKQMTVSLNFSATSQQKISSKQQLTRRVFVSPQKTDDYGLYTMAQDLKQIKQVPLKQSTSKRFISPTSSRKSLSMRSKNLTRFKTETQTNIEKKNLLQDKKSQNSILNELSPNKKQTQLSYNISLEDNLSAK